MAMTEAEMFGALKSAEQGQIVRSEPVTPADPDAWEMFERGWEDISGFLGMNGGRGLFGGNSVGLALAIQCADVKARDISKAEMLLWRRRGARGWSMVEANQHDLSRLLLTKPNQTSMTWVEFWRMTVLHLELAQNAYILKDIATDGTLKGLIPVMPARCRMRVSERTRKIFYEIAAVTEYERAVLGESYFIVPEDRMIHLRGRLYDGVNGLSNTVLGDPIFALLSAISAYQTNLFGNDGKQPLVFETDHDFGDGDKAEAAFRRLKEQLTVRTRKAARTGDPILLEAGLKAKAIALNAKDSSTTESFTQQVMRVCGLMQTPPHKIFALEAVAYNNMSAMDRMYANDCLFPIAVNIEAKFRNATLDEAEWPTFAPQFDRAAMMANDPETLEKLLKTGMGSGLMSFDEGREIMPFRLNPLAKGGDQRTVPVNMSLIAADGTVVQAGVGQNATQPGAGEDESPDNNADKAGPRLVINN